MTVIEKLSDAARKAVRDAHADPQGIVLGCGVRFSEACAAGYLLPVPGTVDRWHITARGREYCLRLMRAH
jgi:hypothetical protein